MPVAGKEIGGAAIGGSAGDNLFSFLKITDKVKICFTIAKIIFIRNVINMSKEIVNPVVGSTPLIELTLQDEDGNLVDLTDSLTNKIILKSPNGEVKEFDAETNENATDGILKYRCTTLDLDIPGKWQAVARTEFEDGLVYESNPPVEFTVDPNLE